MSRSNLVRPVTVLRAAIGLAVSLLLACSTVAAAPVSVHLLPAPREAHFTGQATLPGRIAVSVPGHNADDEFAAHDLEEAVKEIAPPGEQRGRAYRVTLLRADSREAKELLTRHSLAFDAPMQAEGYVLVIEPREAFVIGASGAGVFYGVQTFKQLLPLPGTPRVLAHRYGARLAGDALSRHRRRSVARAVPDAQVSGAPDSRLCLIQDQHSIPRISSTRYSILTSHCLRHREARLRRKKPKNW